MKKTNPKVSVFIPGYNESGNVDLLLEKIGRSFIDNKLQGEVVYVNDGSTDGTGEKLETLKKKYPFLRVFHHRTNFGLTEAMKTGFLECLGEVVIFLPSDLESDPEEDIPKLFHKINEGYDIVAGWRQGRKDGKTFMSAIYNVISRKLFNVSAHDMNWIKAFRREVLDDIELRSDWHRFILMIAASKGYKIGEVKVNWYPRRAGKSKFGFWRIPKSLIDVLVVKFLLTYSKKPMLFFGPLGAGVIILGLSIDAYLGWLWFFYNTQKRPIFIFSLVLIIVGLFIFMVGFLAEMIVSINERLREIEKNEKK